MVVFSAPWIAPTNTMEFMRICRPSITQLPRCPHPRSCKLDIRVVGTCCSDAVAVVSRRNSYSPSLPRALIRSSL